MKMAALQIKTEKHEMDEDAVDGAFIVAKTARKSTNGTKQQQKPSLQEQPMTPTIGTCPTNHSPARAAFNQNQRMRPPANRRSFRPPDGRPSRKGPGFLPGSRCGEIFVTNNARQWTFICTFCTKSTRDIGDFICHIKMKHLRDFHNKGAAAGYYHDDDDDDEDDDGDDDDDDEEEEQEQEQEPSEGCMDEQDYVDCSNYLDINVHTEVDELNYNCSKQTTNKSATAANKVKTLETPKRAEAAKHSKTVEHFDYNNDRKRKAKQQFVGNNIKVDPYENGNDETNRTDVHLTQYGGRGEDNYNDGGGRVMYQNEEFDGEEEEQDEEMDEDDKDFDNQLLLAPEVIDAAASSSSSGGTKAKRGQIRVRGTAYCALCNKTFQYYSLYRNHMIKHSNETPFRCQLCKKGFKSKQAIRYHMNTHSREKQFKCQLCHAGYSTENQLITHVLTHESSTVFPCMICGKILQCDKERDVHLATHTEERPFNCDYCNKRFRQRHHLSNHLKMHCQYRCDFCKEEFSSSQSQRKPYACPACENSPKVRSQLVIYRSSTAASLRTDVNPLELFETVMPPQQPAECLDLAEMVSDSEPEMPPEDHTELQRTVASGSNRAGGIKKRVPCKHCSRSYTHVSALNYHIRTKHGLNT